MSTTTTFLKRLPDWADIVSGKFLLFDSDAIISLIEYEAKDLFLELEKLGVEFCIIHPVYVELLKTDNPAKRVERQQLLDQYKFTVLPLTKGEMDKARDIQEYLLLSKSYTASPTDLYLGGRLATFTKQASIYLLTSNLSDFPSTLYKRETGIVLQNNKSTKIISILSINREELDTVNLNN